MIVRRFRKDVALSMLALGFALASCENDAARPSAASSAKAKATPVAAPAKAAGANVTAPNLDRVQGLLPRNAPVRARWAVDLKDRRIVKFWLPPVELTDIDYMLALTDRNDLVAVQRRSGQTLWWTRLSGPPTGDAYFTNYAVYFIVRSHIVCVERFSGEVVWLLDLPFAPSSGPTVDETNKGSPTVYVPGLDRRIYAMEVELTQWPPKFGTGSVTRDDLLIDKQYLQIVWRYPAYSQVAGNLLFADRQVFAADTLYHVYAILGAELQAGKPKNVNLFRTQGPMTATPTISGPYIFVPSRDRNLYCLSKRDLSEVWRYPSGQILDESAYPFVDPNTNRIAIVQRCGERGPLVGLNDMDGKLIWSLPMGKAVVASFTEPENELNLRSIVVALNRDGSLSGHYFADGKPVWRLPAGEFKPFCLNPREDLIYTAAFGGQILCALEKN